MSAVSQGNVFEGVRAKINMPRIELAAWYLGAAGLALGHTLVAQLLLLGYGIYRLITGRRAWRFSRSISSIILLALAGWMLISSFFAYHPINAFGRTFGLALTGWLTLEAIGRIISDRSGLGKRLLKTFLAFAFLGAIYALVGFVLPLREQAWVPRAQLPFVRCNGSGTILAIATVVAIGCLEHGRRMEKVALGIITLVIFLALLATQSRGAFVGLGAGLAVLAFRYGRRVVWSGLVLVALLIAFVSIYPPMQARYASILFPSANEDRLDIWRTAVLMIKDHPITGIGADNFQWVYGTYPHPGIAGEPQPQPFAHNIFLEFGATTGIPGLLLFAVAVAIAIANGLSAWKREETREAAPVALAAFSTLLIHLQFDITVFSVDMMPLFFILYGVLTKLHEKAPMPGAHPSYSRGALIFSANCSGFGPTPQKEPGNDLSQTQPQAAGKPPEHQTQGQTKENWPAL